MAFRSVSASLTLDTSGYRRALSEAAADTRRLIDQLQGIARVAGMDGVTADVHQLDRALGEVPDTARAAGTSAASAFDGFEAELEQLDDRARAVAREQRQIADAAVEASRRAGGAYRTIGTEAAQAAASARSSLTGLSGVHVGITTSAERAATAEGAIGVAATRSATTARGALSGMAGAHDVVEKEAIQARLAELGIGTAAVSAAELAQRSALEMARSLNVITAAAERAAAAETLIGTSAERAALMAARANTVSGGGGRAPGGGAGVVGGAAEVGALTGLANTFRTISSVAGGLAAFQGFTVLTHGIRDAVVGASDLNEAMNKAKFTFGDSTPVIVNLATEMRTRFGQSRSTILDAAAGFGLMGKAAGLAEPQAAGMAKQLSQLAVDAQSFFNVPLEDVLVRFRSGLAGETEAVRQWGVDLSEATVRTHAYAMGIARVGEELTMAQKVQARFDLILNAPSMKAAAGDMERTADQFANRMRIIGGRLREWAVDVGTAAIPHILKLVDVLENAGRTAGPAVATAFDAIGDALQRLQPFFANIVDIGGDLWNILLDLGRAVAPFVTALGGIAAVGVISALNGISTALSGITGFLAENEDLVRLLAIAYGVTLVPRLAQAAAGIQSVAIATGRLVASQGAGALSQFAGSFVTLGSTAAASGAAVTAGMVPATVATRAATVAAGQLSLALEASGAAGTVAGGRIAGGMSGALAAIKGAQFGLGAIGIAVGAGLLAIDKGWDMRTRAASQWVDKSFGTRPQGDAKAMRTRINDMIGDYNRLVDSTKAQAGESGVFGGLIRAGRTALGLQPAVDLANSLGKSIHATPLGARDSDRRDQLKREIEASQKELRVFEETQQKKSAAIRQVTLQTGVSQREVARILSMQGIDAGDTAGAVAAVSKVKAELDDLASQAGVSSEALASMFNDNQQVAADFLKVVIDVGDKVKGAFLADMDVTTHVNADPKAIADAQKQMADLQSQGKPIPMELQLETQGPLEQLKKFYAQAVEQGKAFGDNARKALALGFDPDLIQRLMLQGPEKAGPLLAALVSQSGSALVGLVNTQEAELRRQSAVVEEIATKQMIDTAIVQSLTTKAVQDESGKRTATLGDAVKVQRAIVLLGEGATFDAVAAQTGLKTAQINAVVDAWGFKLFAAIDSTMGKFQVGGTSGHGGAQFKAQGAVDLGNGRVGTVQGDRRNAHQPEIVKGGTWRVFAEDETQGESYIPHAMDRRPRAQSLLAQTARILGMVAMPEREFKARLDRDTVRLADGAVVARHEWVGGSQRRGSTVEEPHSSAPLRPARDRLRERFVERFARGGVVGIPPVAARDHAKSAHDRTVGGISRRDQVEPGWLVPQPTAIPRHLPLAELAVAGGDGKRDRFDVGLAPRPARFLDSQLRRDDVHTSTVRPFVDRLRERVERFAFGGMQDVRRSERERPGAAHHVSDRRATERVSLVHARTAERFVDGGLRVADGGEGGRGGTFRAVAPRYEVERFALGGRTGREAVRPMASQTGAGVRDVPTVLRSTVAPVPEPLEGARREAPLVRHGVSHRLLRFARGGVERLQDKFVSRRESMATQMPPGTPAPADHPSLRQALPQLRREAPAGHRLGRGEVTPFPRGLVVEHLDGGREVTAAHGLLRFAFGGLKRADDRLGFVAPHVVERPGSVSRPLDRVAARTSPPTGVRSPALMRSQGRLRDVGVMRRDLRTPVDAVQVGGALVGHKDLVVAQADDRRVGGVAHVPTVRRYAQGDEGKVGWPSLGPVRGLLGPAPGSTTLPQPIVRRFAQGGIAESSLPPVPLKELAPYNIGPEGAGRRGLDTTTVMRQTAVQKLTQREQDINRLKLAIATQKGGGGTVGAGQIGQGWASITSYLMSKGVNFIVTSTTGGNHVAGSYHYRGKAADLVGTGKSSMSTIFDTLAMVGSSLAELFYDPKGWYIKNGAQVKGAIGGHSDHVHAATFRMGGVVQQRVVQPGVVVPLTLPRQRPFEKERIRRGRDVIEHGPLGTPRRDPVRSKIAASLRDVLVPKGKAMASGGVLPVAASDQPQRSQGRAVAGGSRRDQVQARVFVDQPAVVAHGRRNHEGASFRVGILGQHRFNVGASGGRPSEHRSVALGPGVVRPQRQRPALPIRQGRDLRDHPGLRLAPFERDGDHVTHLQVGVSDRRDRPGASHAPTLRREGSMARGAQPHIRLALGRVASPAAVIGRDETRGSRRLDRPHLDGAGTLPEQRARQDGRDRPGHLRGLPQSQRMEAPGHARHAAFGVHLPSPTATRHTSETVTVDGRRLPFGRPAEDARRPPVKADRSHSTHAMRWGGLVGGITRSVAEFFGFARGGMDVRDVLRDRTRLELRDNLREGNRLESSRTSRETHTRRDTSRTMQVAPFDLRRATADSSLAPVSGRPGFAARPRAGGGKAGDRPLRISDVATAHLPSFAKGGTVPGALGEPRVIVAHGGEQVQPVQPIHLGAPGGGGGGANFDVTVNVPVGQLGGDVDLDDVRRDVQNAVEAGIKKAGDRFLAGVHRG